jgi:hypothetical protein
MGRRLEAKRAAARYSTPWRDSIKDWIKIKLMWLAIIVLFILLVKYGGGDINH